MNNIYSVHIENFQSHLDTYIEFDNGLNMIVGQSDSGKTAIIRAIRWVLFNQPKGTDFLRVSADFVRVTVTLTNDTIICRERTTSKNRYTIKRPEQDDLILEGFGFSVPQEVLEAHGMGHLRVDTDRELALHVSQQLDGPFLLEETSSTRAKVLGRISGAHFLDMAIRQTSRDVSQLNQRVRHEEEMIEKLEKELEPFANVDLLKKELDLVSDKLNNISSLMEKKQRLERIASSMKQIKDEEAVQRKNKMLVQHVHEWEATVSQLEVNTTKYQAFVRLQTRYNQLHDGIDKCLLWMKKTNDVNKAEENAHILDHTMKKKARLQQLVQLSRQLHTQLENQMKSMQLTLFLNEINANQIDEISKKKEQLKVLSRYKIVLEKRNNEIAQVHDFIARIPAIDSILEKIVIIEKNTSQLQQLKSAYVTLIEYEQRIKEGFSFIKTQTETVATYEHERMELLIKKGTCPTCGQEIKNQEHYHVNE